MVKLSEKKEQEGREKDAKGESAPESLITWIFQDDFIPRARITKDGIYSIMADYLGTPAEAYDDSGTLVWKRELDINGNVMPAGKDRYGRTMEDIGEKNFIPFRFQGQYTQQDPIGLAGGKPTLYGYVYDTNIGVDCFGLSNTPLDFNQAMNQVLEWLESRSFRAEAATLGRFGKRKGMPVGMQTSNGKVGFRVEFDERSGAYINVWAGKEKGPHFQFAGSEKTVERIQNPYSCKG